MRILLIDDDAMLRQTIRRMLGSAGHEVVEAENGRVGLDAFRKQKVDAVVTDIIMPQKEGIETIRDLRVLNPQVRIVAMSGGGRTHQMDFLSIAAKLGADTTLTKPFRKEALLACVEGRERPTKSADSA